MSTRQFLPRALRQCLTQSRQQQPQPKLQRDISTSTSKEAGFRQIRGVNVTVSQQLSQLGAYDNEPAQSHENLRKIMRSSPQSNNRNSRAANAVADLKAKTTTDQYAKLMPRHWEAGQIYAPRDLGIGETRRWSHEGQFKNRTKDAVEALGINPLDNYRNFSMLSEYTTSYGRIIASSRTGLSPVNQRKMAKTIRRAIGLGIFPSVHHHPEQLKLRYKGRGLPIASGPKEKKTTTTTS